MFFRFEKPPKKWYNMNNSWGDYHRHEYFPEQTNNQQTTNERKGTNMKIKNLAFYGVMAAILGSVGTASADGATDSTIIASKGYVDAYAQKQSDRVETTWAASTADHTSTTKYPSMNTLNDALTTVEGNIQSVDTNALARPTADDPKLTKVSAIKGMVTTSGVTGNVRNNNLNAADNASDQKVPSEKAVAVELGLKEDHAATVPVLRSGQTAFSTVDANHSVGVNLGDLDALKEDKSNKQAAQTGATVTRWSTTEADPTSAAYTSDDKYPTVKAVAQQIADIDVSAAVQDGTNALTLTDSATTAPSVTAVKGIADNTTTDYTTRNASNELTGSGSSTKVPTTAAVVSALKDLDMAKISNGTQGDNWEKAVTEISQVDGRVYAKMGQIGSGGIATNAVKTTHIADNNVTFAKILDKTQAQTGTVVPWDTTANSDAPGYTPDDKFPTVKAVAQQIAAGAVTPNTAITPSSVNSIVTYDAKGLVTGGIKLDTTLNEINVTSGGSTCSASNPCVLSYIGNNTYRWTNMDTEGLNAATGS